MPSIKLIVYDSLAKCMKEYFQDGVPLCRRDGYWEWADADGTKHSRPFQSNLRAIRKQGLWGWTENKQNIHVWAKRNVPLVKIVAVVGHELGHCERPFHSNHFGEEQKAAKYEIIARDAYELGNIVYGMIND